MRFVLWEDVVARVRGRSIAIVGSAPSVLDNVPGFIDSHDIVCRINNYRTSEQAGHRCDIHYSFFGSSIKKSAEDLKRDGVRLLWNKCPNSQPIQSEWHVRNGRLNGINFEYIYKIRAGWWFCDVYAPTDEQFRRSFELLGGRVPTTGFAAILDVLACEPASVYLTGFDGFTSGLHNVNERWRPGDPTDPIGHRPELELAWIAANLENYPLSVDGKLTALIRAHRAAA